MLIQQFMTEWCHPSGAMYLVDGKIVTEKEVEILND